MGLALLEPVVPFALEMLALRRLTTAAFGTLMCLEPAIALVVGLVVLDQVPDVGAVLGLACVVAAGVGATRSGGRAPVPSARAAPTTKPPPGPGRGLRRGGRCRRLRRPPRRAP